MPQPHQQHEFRESVVPRPRGVKTIEVDEELMQDIRECVRDRAVPVLSNIIVDIHAADIADIIDHLESEDRLFVFNLLDTATASDVLLELDFAVRQGLLEILSQEKI